MYLDIGEDALEFMDNLVKSGHMPGDVSEVHLGKLEQMHQSVTEKSEEDYLGRLRAKLGEHVRVENIEHDESTLIQLGETMSGDDIIIAPGILSQMAKDDAVAIYYESRVDHCFDLAPYEEARCKKRGLEFRTCGVVVHEDGQVSFVCHTEKLPENPDASQEEDSREDVLEEIVVCGYYVASLEQAEQIRAFAEEKTEVPEGKTEVPVESSAVNSAYVRNRFEQTADPVSFMPELGDQSVVSI